MVVCRIYFYMEFLFSQLKKMDVISVTDGKNMGKVCDLTFLFPENKLKGITVTGCKGFRFARADVFIPMSDVVKIGEDVVLVKVGEKPPKPDRPPQYCPPPCQPNCPPNCPPKPNFDPRRNYDDYE